jgi:hypothetical protein
MRFGITVNEIARENNMTRKEAVTKFLSDVERQYDNELQELPKQQRPR